MKKCTCCGGSNLRKCPDPFVVRGGEYNQICDVKENLRCANSHVPEGHLELLICLDCGHIELFSTGFAEAYKAQETRILKAETELTSLKERLAEMILPFETAISEEKGEISIIEGKISELNKKSQSLDITIREQQAFLTTIESLKSDRARSSTIIDISDRFLGKVRPTLIKIDELLNQIYACKCSPDGPFKTNYKFRFEQYCENGEECSLEEYINHLRARIDFFEQLRIDVIETLKRRGFSI